ncbi:MAG: 2-succinyl-5-enolpyruvyl-6-hydroxy-3-cyclohexene-1-carboxylic-acid synthase [Blautia sp.]|nr:2-succinyl-5-enolpyruvyl-6-hydroxy-3-cyclohexene-1-carboxylic-acid synthase [Lachnoclostridium sp.]MCM1211843.1 2-succinyl-5-enolpyruvyl-6-hydroxy-3-cyclohexene-1-carboxylic-acid synthase [Blautia sp.]
MKKHYDVAIAGFWYGANYGSLLNGYAMYYIIKSLGKDVLMINKPNASESDIEITEGHNVDFIKKYYDSDDISPVLSYSQLEELNEICDCFCAGSDQIWNYPVSFGGIMYLPFVNVSKKLISFATSFGNRENSLPNKVATDVKEYLSRYNAISVREKFSADILREKCGLNSQVVFEPVFCVDRSIYDEIAKNSDFIENEPYLLTYILDPTQSKCEAVKWYAEKMGLKIINIPDGKIWAWEKKRHLLTLPNILENVHIEDLLKAYSGATYVITDSFHGTAFSILYQKPFISIGNYNRGYERFSDLLGRLKLMARLVVDPQNIPLDENLFKPIDYTETNEIVSGEAKKTVEWIRYAIETPKEKLPSIIIPEAQMADALYQNPEFIKIRLLATLLRDYGVKHIVLSPGGRDVPLVRMFEYNEDSFILHRVTDERSAAYYGMGIAAQLRQPVVCVCTSGTAASNYLPAVTEAYYTGIPLIVITADRQQVYLNHGEDQTIPQQHIYDGVIKKSVTLPEASGYKAEYQARRDISDCILETTHNGFGPVHINIAIDNISVGAKVPREYWKLLPRINPHILRVSISDGQTEMMRWVNELRKSAKVLVVYGQNPPPTEKQLKNIERFASKYNCVIVTDFISNLDCAYSLQPYNMLQAISNDEFNKQLSPDILVTVGGKRLMNDPLTFKVRGGLKNIRHWSVVPNGKVKDFYFRLTSVLEMPQDFFFEWFSLQAGDIVNNGVYYNKWKEMTEKYSAPAITGFNAHYVQSRFIPIVPENSLLHLGVGQSFIDSRRYSIKRNVEVFCNMGTNGIDGCTSTFMGQCSVIKDRLCFLLVGDLSFFYDMNSIWNKAPEKNVRILMVNNSGSGLLRGHNLKAVTAEHHTSVRGWVETTNFKYISASTKEEYDEKLQFFVSEEPEEAVFFEVFCD